MLPWRQMIQAWRTDGICQVALNAIQERKTENAFDASKRFFRLPLALKSQCISDLAYFHEPNFSASVRPLFDPSSDEVKSSFQSLRAFNFDVGS